MFQKQGLAVKNSDDIWSMLASGNYTVDQATADKAKSLISEDGYWGVDQTSDRIFEMAKALSASTIVPAIYQNNSSNCLIAIEQAQRMKVSPMMVMQNLYPIQGKPCWSAQFLIAQVNNSGNCSTMKSRKTVSLFLASVGR